MMNDTEQIKRPLRILHLEDNPGDAQLVRALLEADGLTCDITRVQSRGEFETAMVERPWDLIISDFSLPGFNGLAALDLVRRARLGMPFILVSGTLGEERAVESLKAGATDYVLKNRPDRLPAAVRRSLREAEARARRRQAEEKIREQAELLDKARDAICVRDIEDHITFWNQGAARIYGWTPEEAQSRRAVQLLSPQASSADQEAHKAVLEKGEWAGELRHVAKDGRPLILESRLTLIRDSEGNPKSVLSINTDITEKKQLEAQFLRAQRMESLGSLAGGIAHDLNNILAPILMASDLLGEEPDAESRKQMLATVKSCAKRGGEMVKQILSFARGSGGTESVVRMRLIMTEMARLAKDTFPRSIRIQTEIAPDVPPVLGNSTQLHQVLMNLCVNARDAMPDGGDLRLSVGPAELKDHAVKGEKNPVSGRYVCFQVSDTGIGMPPEVMARIFEPFFTTKPEGRGTGLGLATVLGITKNHGGFVEVLSEVGKGTTVRVFLPAAPSESTPAKGLNPATPPMGKGEQILVVDDEAAMLGIMRESLEAYNYRVLTAGNGAEAMELYRRQKGAIQAVITDMMMPIMDGPALIHELQQIDPEIKIIAISGLDSESHLARTSEVKVNAFVKKPCTTASLMDVLHSVLTKGGAKVRE